VSLGKYKHPIFPGLRYKKSSWTWDPDFMTDFEQDFMMYSNYRPEVPHIPPHNRESVGE